MGFGDRTTQANTLIEQVTTLLWEHPSLKSRFHHIPFGYETHIPDPVRQRLRFVYTMTARHIKFAPDFFLLDHKFPEKVYLLEYKCTQTPIALESRVEQVRTAAGKPQLKAEDIGQMEEAAYDNYSAIQSLGVSVAIINYCAFHPRLLLCDFIENVEILLRASVTTPTQTGSRTPFVNFDLNSMRTLDLFLTGEHRVAPGVIAPAFHELKQRLITLLPVKPWKPLY
ncbi:hypothetical protein M1O17_04875 [Dehalococcoidia bacterium]|nr:hypothetical protein [Dehalococcoidia bacterium]MCL0102457.1 hypothetical protein [Dehalococcoidia bacterium]